MKSATFFFVLVVLGFLFLEQVGAQTSAPSTSSMRRNYPGGKDDGDLTVQSVRKITRKGDDVELDYHSASEPSEGGAVTPPPTAETNSGE